jgi:hypothetical protein
MTELSPTSPEFERFLFAPLQENSEAPLSVLSALARQDIDPWQEAARLAELPKDHAVNSLASTIWKSDSERWSPSAASITAAQLIELLPSHGGVPERSVPADGGNNIMMWVLYGVIFWSVAVSGNINQRAGGNANLPNHTGAVVAQQEAVSQPSRGTSMD